MDLTTEECVCDVDIQTYQKQLIRVIAKLGNTYSHGVQEIDDVEVVVVNANAVDYQLTVMVVAQATPTADRAVMHSR